MSMLKVFLLGDATGLTRALSKASTQLQKFSGKVKSVGGQVSSLSMPLALAGGTAVKMASDFDKSMTMVKSLVGVAGDEVDAMAPRVKSMATQFGISSSQSAEALFFITSAGLRGAEAMDVLNASLKASAVGLGETKVVADLATSALNAYGTENISAVGATDVLTAAVREGKLEADTLGQAMGSVLPIASSMGVQFHEVGAAFAAMSRTGTNAFQASTQLRGILNSLLKPSSQAEEMLGMLGMSSQGLRQQIKDEGLLSVLETLKQSFEGNDMAAQTVFGNVRALSGVLDLLGSNVQTTRDIFGRMQNTLGTTDKAFDETRKSSAFKLKQALTSLRNSFSSLGESIMVEVIPKITKMVGVIRGLFQRFLQLSPEVKKITMGFAGLVVALPVLTTVIGAVGSALALLLSPITLVVAGVTAIAVAIYKNWNQVLPVITKIINYFIDLYNESMLFRGAVQLVILTFKTLWSIGTEVVGGLKDLFSGFGEFLGNIFGGLGDVIKAALTFDGDLLDEGLEKLGSSFDKFKDIVKERATNIAETFVDNFNQAGVAFAQKGNIPLVTDEQVQAMVNKGIQMGANLVSGFNQGVAGLNAGTGVEGQENGSGDEEFSFINLEKMEMEMEILEQFGEKTMTLGEKIRGFAGENMGAIMSMSDAFATTMASSMTQTGNALKGIGEGIKETIKQIIKQLIKAIIKTAILKAITGGLGKGSGGGGGILGFFKSVGKSMLGGGGATPFATGGIVSAPTLAMVGEYGGAKRNPEVIAPLNKLKDMMPKQSGQGMGGAVSFRIEGQDLVGVLDKAEDTRNRLT